MRMPTKLATDQDLKDLVVVDFQRMKSMEVIYNGTSHKIKAGKDGSIHAEVTSDAFATKIGITHNQALNAFKFLTQLPGPLPQLPMNDGQVALYGKNADYPMFRDAQGERIHRLEITDTHIETTYGFKWKINFHSLGQPSVDYGTITTYVSYKFSRDALHGPSITADDDNKCEVKWSVTDFSIA